MTPVELLLSKLPTAKKAGKGWSARCPAHEDRRASLSVSAGDNGTALVKCHAGCETAAILAAAGLKLADLFPEKACAAPARNKKLKSSGKTFATAAAAVKELERQHGKRSASWTYHDATGNPVGLVVRWDLSDGKKDIRPVALHPDGWRIGAMPEPRPLYRLAELAKAKRVVVTEGEKCADAARTLGFTATTSAGGSQAAEKADWRPLAGKEVWLFPDNDLPGRKYGDTVAAILAKLTPRAVVRIVELPDLPEGGDIVDWIEAHGDAAEPNGMTAEIEALAAAVRVETTNPTTHDLEAFRPFPVDALPEPIRSFTAAAAKSIGCDSSFVALPLLVALASAIGMTRRLELKRGWTVTPILWGAAVGESGSAKTPAFRVVMRPVWERQRRALERFKTAMERYEAELAEWQSQPKDERGSKPVRPELERCVVQDTTVEALAPILLANPRGLLLARDELSGWVGSFDRYASKGKAGTDAANWLSMHSAECIIVDRRTGDPRMIHVPHAAVCIVGGIQPGILRRAMGAEHRESGLLARLLLTYPPRKKKQWTEAGIDPEAEASLDSLFNRLFDLKPAESKTGEPFPAKVSMTADAKRAWIAYYNAHGDEQAELTGDLSAAWSKLEEYAARLALVVHLIRWAANDKTLATAEHLDISSMNAGIALTTWFKGEARRVYAMLTESDAERDGRRLVEWIDRKGGTVTAREVQQGCRWLKEPGAAEAALESLAESGRGCWEPTPDGQRGQPTRRFRLSTSTVFENPTGKTNTVDVDTSGAAEAATAPADGRLFPEERGLPD
jgi:Protein of unknown function (DUF3987)